MSDERVVASQLRCIGPAVDEEEMKINSCRKKSTTLKISSSARDFLAFLQ
jgi:hypothetical protein